MLILIPHGFQEHYTIGFTNGLASNGIDVCLISFDKLDNRQVNANVRCKNLRGSTSEDRTILEKATNYIRYYFGLLLFVYKNRESVVHISGGFRYEIAEGILQNIVLRVLSKKLILTVHNVLPHDRETTMRRLIYRIIYHVPNYLVVHTSRMREILISVFGIARDRIVKMEHGINDAVPADFIEKEQCRRKLGIPFSKIVILFFGNIAPYKGVDLLLGAFEKMDARFYLIIAGKEKTREYGKNIAKLLGKNKNRRNILYNNKWIPDENIGLYFNAADALVMPYRNIDQSGVLFLAWRFGLPTIAFAVGSLRDYIDKRIGVIVETSTAESLKDAFNRFCERKEKYCTSVIKQRADRFAWNRVVKTILGLYN
jgi:glycosyltransferase involved in cell wall biosynthesis